MKPNKEKHIIKGYITLLFSVWLFFVFTGFTFYEHYCGGEFEGISFLAKTEMCEHTKEKSCCETDSKETCCSVKEGYGCCLNQTFHIDIDQEYLLSKAQFSFISELVYTNFISTSFTYLIKNRIRGISSLIDPPPIPISIEQITQCFRI